MAGRNGQQLAIVKPFACYLPGVPQEKLPPFVIAENCSLVNNA